MSIDVVIGANYGDEGKGLTVARIAKLYDPRQTFVIMGNGGAQRGHSVIHDGKQHIFKHFNSATPLGVRTFFSPDYILDPIQFNNEKEEIKKTYGIEPIAVRSASCKWATPWDIMANQMLQKENWTGSCGMGIWETVLRYRNGVYMDFDSFAARSHDEQVEFLKKIRDYYEGVRKIKVNPKYRTPWYSDILIEHFIRDFMSMFECCKVSPSFLNLASKLQSQHFIIENGQGLLLGDKGFDDKEATPSNTGLPSYIDLKDANVHFVTRPYITRHGSDTFVGRKLDCDLNKSTEINQYNEWQHDFFYDYLDLSDLKQRCDKEVAMHHIKRYTVEVTHCDELDREAEFKNIFHGNCNFYDTNKL